MHALFLVLNKTELLEDILHALAEAGVRGATILDSQGMGSAIVHGDRDYGSMFGSFKSMFDRQHPYNKTIFTIIEDDALLEKAIEAIKSTAGDLSQPNEGLMFTLPVSNVMGMR